MYVMVLYDISDDRPRLLVSRVCKDMGLRRLQNSVFVGHATPTQRERLAEAIASVLGGRPGLVHIMPLHLPNIDGMVEIYVPKPPQAETTE